MGVSVENLLNDFQLTFEYCGCEVTSIHKFYGAMFNYQNESLSENAKIYIETFT